MNPECFDSLNLAILGAGREGLAAARFLRALSPDRELTLICESPPGEDVVKQLHSRDRLLVCPFADAALDQFDVLVRSPGVSPYRASLQSALSSGVKITSPSNLWFAAHPHARTLCVTGTKGKSTTSAMIAHALNACGLKVKLAGNIGQPLLCCGDNDVDWWVIELSSYQLADLEARPDIAVILNLSAEHLDWHGSEENYRRDKLRLAGLVSDGGLILNAEDPVLAGGFPGAENAHWYNRCSGIHVSGEEIRQGKRRLPVQLSRSLPGRHNLSNAAAALTAVQRVGVDVDQAAESLSDFRGLPHRLQLIGERDEVRFFNDSISSTPVATEAALAALKGQKITLIVGGLDRGLDWTPYMETFAEAELAAVIGVPDNGDRVIRSMQEAGIAPEHGLHPVLSLDEAVGMARHLTPRGGLVLLSPGAPSFPHFRDYRDRGQQFSDLCGFELKEWAFY